jgi:NADH dehydrogenase FAD-containing subunit
VAIQAPGISQIIVIIGGSFTGVQLSKILVDSLPTGYRVLLIERNSHLNYSFNFPRYSVSKGMSDGHSYQTMESLLQRLLGPSNSSMMK